MLIVTIPKGEPGRLAVSQVGVRTRDAEGVFDSKLWEFEGYVEGKCGGLTPRRI
jgi:hypothetical protein